MTVDKLNALLAVSRAADDPFSTSNIVNFHPAYQRGSHLCKSLLRCCREIATTHIHQPSAFDIGANSLPGTRSKSQADFIISTQQSLVIAKIDYPKLAALKQSLVNARNGSVEDIGKLQQVFK